MATNVLVLNKSWLVTGAGDPEGAQEAPVGSLFLREDGEAGASLYVKETGDGPTGWVPFMGTPVLAAERLLGRGQGESGPAQELTLGPNLRLAGTILYGTTAAHAASHYPGGADPITTLPKHASTHSYGGSDPITALNAAVVTSGTFVDARLSANIPRKNVRNTFAETQVFARPDGVALVLEDTSQPANARKFQVVTGAGRLWLQAIDDAEAGAPGWMSLGRTGLLITSGPIIERNRAVPMGEWQSVEFNAANFSAAGGGVWAIGAPAVVRNRYTVIGKTMTWSIYVSWFLGSNVTVAPVNGLQVQIPGGFTCPGNVTLSVPFVSDGGAGMAGYANVAGAILTVYKQDSSNFTAMSPGFIASFTFEID